MTILERLKSSLEKCCDLHFECRKWGDGSSEEGVTNIVCDDLGIVIASDVEEAIAELFVALNNNAPALLEVVEVLCLIEITGPDNDNTYWMHVDSGRFKGGINMGTNRDAIMLKAFLEFEKKRKQSLAKLEADDA